MFKTEGGGRGQGHFWTMSKRKTPFYVFPYAVVLIKIAAILGNWQHWVCYKLFRNYEWNYMKYTSLSH